jgi:hypothetical protein
MEGKRIPTIGHYRIVNFVGKGSYGACYSAVNKKKPEELVALKLEKRICLCPQLEYEYKVMKFFTGKGKVRSTMFYSWIPQGLLVRHRRGLFMHVNVALGA